ncbi:hypothetical protein HBI25_079980 [Parastagonospora nodorum]|nr:hypothetical protein HBH54_216560 [Parastagonospora nodorum]KAH3946915.1 hypothetical protein HBH53_123750 [Parastagonospora nodorum]KAH3969518.1 hypothetical protein HBH52_171760 [Parastagonospora nodorum]KAH4127652.1 hypothetical protein HBH45_214550 [Parastagonospora nodorum]KAH4186494.1 hypothetical protein HBH42_166820 [Parastagonospora nodorum]
MPTNPHAKVLLSGDMTVNPGIWLYGDVGNELALQFKYGEACNPWEETDEHISPEELGIDRNEVVGFRGTIEGFKKMGFWA